MAKFFDIVVKAVDVVRAGLSFDFWQVPALQRPMGILGIIQESFPGAWQRNIEVDSCENILKFSAVYACVSLISDDISKLRIKLVQLDDNQIWNEVTNAAFSPVLRKPNRYQTHIQFLSQWIVCKLLWEMSTSSSSATRATS